MSLYKKILLPSLGLILAASCSTMEEEMPNGPATGLYGTLATVRFSVTPETSALKTRLTNDGDTVISHIAKGEKLDMLQYAVYVKNSAGEYILDSKYSGEITDYGDGRLAQAGYSSTSHAGHYIRPVDFILNDRVEVVIPDMRVGETYKVAFWTQNSQAADAYDTSDLRHVEVKYKDADGNNFANNDETRDAFCQVWEGTVTADMPQEEITLYRPLSQINVGTTGADYKNIMQGPNRYPLMKITHSEITVKGVARFFSVVDSKILADEGTTDVTYSWAPLPAYLNMDGIPEGNAGLLNSQDEEYLRVELNGDDHISDFLTSYPTRDDEGNYLTETFKYLSMCYVLAPAGDTGHTVLDNIEVGFANDENGTDGVHTINVTSAPAGRNCRTNILGGLFYMKDPGGDDDPGKEDPKDPDDPGKDDPNNPDNPDDPGKDDPNDPDNPDNPDNPDDPKDPDDPPSIPSDPSGVTSKVKICVVIDANFNGRDNGIIDQDTNAGSVGNPNLNIPNWLDIK